MTSMAPADYVPGKETLVPGADAGKTFITGAGNYNDASPVSAMPGADSTKIAQQVAQETGVTVTDAAAVLAWLLPRLPAFSLSEDGKTLTVTMADGNSIALAAPAAS